MRLLLDTHVFLWANAEPARLAEQRAVLADPENELLLSAASAWEIAIKHGLGRLPLPESPVTWVPSRARALGCTLVTIEHQHALAVGQLPPLHRDPFDRLLVAQAAALGATLVTADRILADYPVPTLMVG